MLEMFSIWQIIGVGLAAWVLWDLFAGYAYLHRVIYRSQEPALYWVTMVIWSAVALWCLFAAG